MVDSNTPPLKTDPTALTTDALRREIFNLGEIVAARLKQIEVERKSRIAERNEDITRAKDTAQRLEREVEQTAVRLEKQVEATALRLEKAVTVALDAVSATAVIHADAHDKEHQSHERIHGVEKTQVDRAATMMDKKLEDMNEFRGALKDAQALSVTRELFDSTTDTLGDKINIMEKRMAYYAGFAAAAGAAISLIIRLSTS